MLYTGPHWNQELPFRVQEIVHFLIVDFHIGDLHLKAGVLTAKLGDSVKHQITQPGYDPLPSTLHAPHHGVRLPWPYMYRTVQCLKLVKLTHNAGPGAIQLRQTHFWWQSHFNKRLHIYRKSKTDIKIWSCLSFKTLGLISYQVLKQFPRFVIHISLSDLNQWNTLIIPFSMLVQIFLILILKKVYI